MKDENLNDDIDMLAGAGTGGELEDLLNTDQPDEMPEDETKLPEELDYVDENIFPSSSMKGPDDPQY